MEFAELRDYYPGDDLRRLDWKAYGRSDKFFLKEYESETNARIYFLLDPSGSMNFKGEQGPSRLEFCKSLAATLSSLFLYQSDAVGVAQMLSEGMLCPLRRGESSLPRLLDDLREISAEGETKLADQLHTLAEQIPHRSLVLILSDFFTPLEELEDALMHLRHRAHEVSFLQVLSQDEIDLPETTRTSFRDLESGQVIKTSPSAIRAEYQENLQAHIEGLKKMAVKMRAEHYLIPIEEGVEAGIQQILLSHIES